MPRLFLGIEIPHETKEIIGQSVRPLQTSLKGWESPHDYHVTLLFIGGVSDEKVQPIKDRLNQIHFAPFSITTKRIDFFPRRVMYVSFYPSIELLQLKSQVEDLYPEWNRPDQKPFVAHLTLKRWQRYEYDELVEGLKTHQLPHLTVPVRTVQLFKSEKDMNGNKYHIV